MEWHPGCSYTTSANSTDKTSTGAVELHQQGLCLLSSQRCSLNMHRLVLVVNLQMVLNGLKRAVDMLLWLISSSASHQCV
jgi:hypothetical protein